jgi:hypothetical protein
MKPLKLTTAEKEDLLRFLSTLDEDVKEFTIPVLPN